MDLSKKETIEKLSFDDFKKQVVEDYTAIVLSRELSYLGRREVFSGKGKFGIFGDGKELPQIVMHRFFKNGDFRSGYYRDQTLLLAQGILTPEKLFAALYADLDLEREPMSGGRQMGGHYVTPSMDKQGQWKSLVDQVNHSSDISPTAAQMPRLVGLAQASKIYRSLNIKGSEKFSNNGDEIAWGTIGNASTSEGVFFEAINAAGVLQIPMVISIWDDDYGISVHNKDQTTKESISEALKGFQRTDTQAGFEIIKVKGWDYLGLIDAYDYASQLARKEHVPVLVHVVELTQPLGHSSSGSHERYKSEKRLQWEKEHDCNTLMRQWILSHGIADEETLIGIEKAAKTEVRVARRKAWEAYQKPIEKEKNNFRLWVEKLLPLTANDTGIQVVRKEFDTVLEVGFKDIVGAGRKIKVRLTQYPEINTSEFDQWLQSLRDLMKFKISSHIYTASKAALLAFEPTPPTYAENPKRVDGRIIIRDNFEALLSKNDKLLIFGEDVGKIGDVNQGLEGLQAKFGETRIADTGIREATIVGQGIGMALRGLRPIAEIQYLDYILYCIQILSDDLACLNFRTFGQQIAPLIIRTRGHRLEGIWHSGSPMGGMVSLLRGIHILVPRNMTQAAGFYNTLMQIDQPAIVVESLNGYRLKEHMPENLGTFTVPLGTIEVLRKGSDLTVLSYGSTLRIVQEAAHRLAEYDIDIEIIDVQSLIPFDLKQQTKESLQATNRLLIVDEDVPGGASSYILQQLLEKQNIYQYLDSAPKLLSAKSHRPAYGTDGDYFSKPNVDDIFETVYQMMHEAQPNNYPAIY